MVHHSTIHPASYKGYGCNNAKPPRPPHCNIIIDVVVLGCGPIPMGDGATALFNGVHILGEIKPAGGFDTLAESQWKDRIGPSIPVRKINHTTINCRGHLFMFTSIFNRIRARPPATMVAETASIVVGGSQ